MKTNEEQLLIESCLEESNFDEVLALIDFICIKDMIKMQEMQNIFAKFSKTKSGSLRKGSSFWNMLDGRLDFAVEQTNHYINAK